MYDNGDIKEEVARAAYTSISGRQIDMIGQEVLQMHS